MNTDRKKVVIIGATSGIGKALAIKYAKNSCVVGITCGWFHQCS